VVPSAWTPVLPPSLLPELEEKTVPAPPPPRFGAEVLFPSPTLRRRTPPTLLFKAGRLTFSRFFYPRIVSFSQLALSVPFQSSVSSLVAGSFRSAPPSAVLGFFWQGSLDGGGFFFFDVQRPFPVFYLPFFTLCFLAAFFQGVLIFVSFLFSLGGASRFFFPDFPSRSYLCSEPVLLSGCPPPRPPLRDRALFFVLLLLVDRRAFLLVIERVQLIRVVGIFCAKKSLFHPPFPLARVPPFHGWPSRMNFLTGATFSRVEPFSYRLAVPNSFRHSFLGDAFTKDW